MTPALALLLLPTAIAAAAPPLLVLPLPDSAAAGAVDEGLRAGLADVGGYSVLAPALTATHLTSAAQMGVQCPLDDAQCLRKLAVLAEVDDVLVPTVVSGELVVRLLVVAEDNEGRTARRPLADAPARAAREAVVMLLAPERAVGQLQVQVTPAGAIISLDGNDVGPAPLGGALTDLAPGAHTVAARRDGFEPAETRVEVPFGGTSSVALELTPSPTTAGDGDGDTSPDSTVATVDGEESMHLLTMTGLGVTAVGGIATLAALAAAGGFETAVIVTLDDLKSGRGSAEAVNQMTTGAAISWVTSIIAGGVLVVGLGVYSVGLLAE